MIASETTPHTALVTPVTSKSVVRFMDTADASCSSNVDQIFRRTPASTSKEPTELQCATLLLSVADIVSKEIDSEGIDWEDDISDPPPLSLGDTENIYSRIVANSPDAEAESRTRTSITAMDVLSRARSVSLDMCDDDSSQERSHKRGCTAASSKSGAAVISPIHSPVTRRNPRRTSKIKALLLNTRSEMPTRKYVEAKGTRTGPVKTILRKKFSWKNYPELEAFLIANREEYLRHSALNYTIQQKHYNNQLTERLLELAADHGYVFDDEAFSFVTVRDRIRCYFKSYVQSAKKRGVVIGYAARKAGLFTEDDIERSAGKAGRIVMPS